MLFAAMRYEGSVYRPATEAGSLIVQASVGCAYNRCTFCGHYQGVRHRVRPMAEIVADLDEGLATFGEEVRSVFLGDGNGAALPTETLCEIGNAVRERFPKLERITVYGSPLYLRDKSKHEWRKIAAAGITCLHVGLETGDELILAALDKGFSIAEAVACCRRVAKAGLTVAVYLMIGVGGTRRSQQHAVASAELINRMCPDSVHLRTLIPAPGTETEQQLRRGELELLDAHQAVAETRTLVQGLEGPTALVSDHISNFVNVEGRIPEDKAMIIGVLDDALTWPLEVFRAPTRELIGKVL